MRSGGHTAPDERRERDRRVDRRHLRPSALLGGRCGDAPPPIDPRAPADHVSRDDGRDTPHAELGRLLDDEVHARALEERWRQDQLERGLAMRTAGGDDDSLRRPVGDARQLDLVLRALLVEQDHPFTGTEAERAQVSQRRSDDADAGSLLGRAGDEEPQHQDAGRSTSVHQPSSR